MKPLKEKTLLIQWGISTAAIILGISLFLLGQRTGGSLLAGLALGWSLNGWYTRRTLLRPIQELISQAGQGLLRNSVLLTDAVIALTQGKLTARLELQPQSFADAPAAEIRPFVSLLRGLQAALEDSAREYNTLTGEPCQRLFYVGADTYLEGRLCAELMAQELNGQGSILIYTLHNTHTSVTLRVKGFEGLLREKYPGLRVIGKIEQGPDPEKAYRLTSQFLKEHPDLNGIYVTDGSNPPGAARAAAEAKLAGKIKFISHDLVPATMEYLAQGVITATLGQDPYAQGHDPIIHLFNHLSSGWRPETPRLLTRRIVVTKDNYTKFWQDGVGVLESKEMSETRAAPLKPSARPLRIAVLGREDSAFWQPVRAGAMAAAQKLRGFNAEVEWLTPETDRKLDIQSRIELLDELIEQGVDGLVLDLHDQRLVPPVNRAAARGIPVAVFNGEPSSLRGLLTLVSVQTRSLLRVSQELAEAAQKLGGQADQNPSADRLLIPAQARQAGQNGTSVVARISQAASEVAVDAVDQAQAAENVSTAIDQITHAIHDVVKNIQAVSQAAASSAQTAQQGEQTVQQILQQIQDIHEAVEVTAETVGDMNSFSYKVGEITETIKDLTDQTALLSLNASIVAAGASQGAQGFTVIASEIRSLAEQSTRSTREIGEILNSAKKSIGRANQSIENALERVQAGRQLASASGRALEELTASAQAMQKQTLPLVDTGAAVDRAVMHLSEASQRVSAIIAENVSATQEINATTQELAAQTLQVSRSAAQLASIARELEGSIAVFQVGDSA